MYSIAKAIEIIFKWPIAAVAKAAVKIRPKIRQIITASNSLIVRIAKKSTNEINTKVIIPAYSMPRSELLSSSSAKATSPVMRICIGLSSVKPILDAAACIAEIDFSAGYSWVKSCFGFTIINS